MLLFSERNGSLEEHMMSQRSKRELLEVVQPRYLKVSRKGKTRIMNEFVAATGYHRKYANRLLKHGRPHKSRKRRGRRKIYQGEVVVALTRIWEICGRICSKRLQPFLPEMGAVLERHNEMELCEETKQLLLKMSRATLDRCLQPARFGDRKGLSTTKPGSLLKKAIPGRTFDAPLPLGTPPDPAFSRSLWVPMVEIAPPDNPSTP
jgi:hypothetical protein